ncbi:MAG: Transcriptional regulator, TrmB family [Candidatus Methanohalarchaeum thermophilum]|uniref:Transcriptional regulator, TrmB family n=1 Tax=Methanohalarchaeum thermophilum TaxID=1903181 RepID=A0A1Q6DSR6_METT1|nr:MAG: Transcriptional regulator, TrmB family [Candidatus Methanohalarchaeum thermophilum]
MPIGIDEFEKAPEDALEIGEKTNADKVLSFLLKNPKKAFTRKELIEATEIKSGSIGVTLSRLRKKGLIRHKGNYWALARDERLASYASEVNGTKIANEELGEEKKNDWI